MVALIAPELERRVTIFIVILDNASNRMDRHLVKTQLACNPSFMTEAMAKNIEVLESRVKSFLTVLCSRQKRLDMNWELILFQHYFIRFASITTVSDTLSPASS